MVELRILGPVEAVHDGSVIALGGPRHRRLLAVLALNAGRVVPVASLTEALWGQTPPRSAPAMLHVRVSELRSVLRAAGKQVVTSRAGYLLRVDRDEVDAERFERLLAAGTAALAGGDPERASADLRSGLALWRGPALAEFADEPFALSATARLGELRLQAVEAKFAADLELGRDSELIAELEKVVAEHPLRERFREQRMLALYRAGRQGEALQAFQAARKDIAEQLGLEPGSALQRLHLAILNADPALNTPSAAPGIQAGPHANAAPRHGVPAQLPADVPAFTGRAAHLDDLDRMLIQDSQALAAVVVSGTAGVGKTALAIHWGHRNRDRYPDGQLYLNLRGYDPNRPMAAAEALTYLLTALGVPNGDIPLDLAQREARYRTTVSGRRMLIVLDNASSEEQVRPLLPGTDACAVLVTSRDSLAGLVARDGVHRLNLDLLAPEEADALVHRLIGRAAGAEPDAVTALVGCCARLPLALRVAAELAVSRPEAPLSTLVAELADQQRRLDLLDAGSDPRAAVSTVFSWSLRHLPADAARTFRLLGLHPGANVDAYAVAALTGSALAAAQRALDALARAHLVQPAAPGRYGMHDLLHAYAASIAHQHDSATDRSAALDRLFDYYLALAAAAILRLHPTDVRRWPGPVAEPTTPAPDLTAPGAATAWLDAERQTLVGLVAYATGHGRPGYSVRLSTVLFRYLDAGHNFDALTVHQYASEAAERSGDLTGQAEALNGLGIVHLRLGQYDAAIEYLRGALSLFGRAGNPLGQARALGNAGIAEELRGHHRVAAECQRRALELYREVGDRLGEARCIDNLGMLERRLGRYQAAAQHHTRALSILREIGDRYGQAIALNNLGAVEQRLGHYPRATHHLEEALALSRQLGDRTGEAWSLTYLGGVHARAGRATEAADRCREALAIFREIGDRDGEPRALNGLGEAAHAAARPAEARTHHAAALALAVEIKAPDEQARAHAGLGHAHLGLGSPDRARHHYEHAVALYEGLDAPEAGVIRAQLAASAR
jgi:DNA-binding SARP family transcriptional activator/Tfp pilus assembly protein PilF